MTLAAAVRVCPCVRRVLVLACVALLSIASPAPATADGLEQALAGKRVTVELAGVPLSEVLQVLQSQTGVTVTIDSSCREALAATGDRFTARVKDVPALTVLDALLEQRGLLWRSDGVRVEIVPAARAGAEVVTRAYPVGDLLPTLPAEATAGAAGEELVRWIAGLDGAVDWRREPAALVVDHDTLWVTHTRVVQARVAALLETLRGVVGDLVEFRAALIEVPLERWRAIAPVGAREWRAEEFDDVLREARNKSRVLREFGAAAREGEAASFETESIRTVVTGWRNERRGARVVPVPIEEAEAERVRCVLTPAVLASGGPIRVGVRCELRRREPSVVAAASAGKVELPRSAVRELTGSIDVKPGGAFAWRIGGLLENEERDRVLALIVRVVSVRRAGAAAGARLSAGAEPKLAGLLAGEPLPALAPIDALAELARRVGLGLVHGPVPAGGEAVTAAPGTSVAAIVRATCARLGLEVCVKDGALCLAPVAADGAWQVVRLPGESGAMADAAAPTPLAQAVRGGTSAGVAELFPDGDDGRARAGADWLQALAPGAVRLPGGLVLWRGRGDELAAAGETTAEPVVVEADVLEVDALRAAERGDAGMVSGLTLEAAAARAWIDAADLQKGVDRRVGLTWSSSAGRVGGASERQEAAFAVTAEADGCRSVRLSTGLALRVRVGRDGDGYRVDAVGEWAELGAPVVTADGAASAGVPAVSLTAVRGGARVADGGALAFALTAGAAAEQRTLLLLVRVSRPVAESK